MAPTLSPLPFSIRADLYSQLAALEKAGLPADKAFALLRLPATAEARRVKTRTLLAKGLQIAAAGLRSGLFTELEANLIDAATSAGSPAATYRRLANHYSQRAAQIATIRSRLMLPALMLIAALFIQPLPALITGSLTAGRYLLHCLQPLIALAGIACLAALLSNRLNHAPSSPSRKWVEKTFLAMPLFGSMHRRRNIRDFFESLALMLEAGMPILDALPKATEAIRNHMIRSEFIGIRAAIEQGATLAQALSGLSCFEKNQALALINTGEGSGTVPEMLFRYAGTETDAIDNFQKEIAAWLPRIVYALIAVWIAYGILSGAGTGSRLPETL